MSNLPPTNPEMGSRITMAYQPRTLERLLVWVQVGLGGETPWVSTSKGIVFGGLTHQKSHDPISVGIPLKKGFNVFFFRCYIFLSGVQGKYVKIYLILYVYSTDSCWPPNAGSLWLTHRLWTRISATGRSKNRAKFTFHNFMAKRNHMERHKKWKSSTWTCILVAVSRLYTHCYLNLPSKMGTNHSKHPTITWCDRIPWLWRPFVIC